MAGEPLLSETSRKKDKRHIRSQTDGFTLLEVLVALAVLGLSLTVLMAIFSQGLQRTRDDTQKQAMRALAQSLLAQIDVSSPDFVTSASGRTSQDITWHILVSDYGTSEDRSAWSVRPVVIIVKVCARANMGSCFAVRTLRLLPKESAS